MSRSILLGALAGALLATTGAAQTPPRKGSPGKATAPFSVVEAGIPDLRAALEQHRLTSRELVVQYLTRIATYEKTINAAVAINAHAIADAEALRDRYRHRLAVTLRREGQDVLAEEIFAAADQELRA